MKSWLFACLFVVLSGCTSPSNVEEIVTAEPSPPTPDMAEPAPMEVEASFEARGTLWLPPSDGTERKRTTLPVLVNVSGTVVDVRLRLGNMMAGAEVPASLADVAAQLVDPAQSIVSEGEMQATTLEQKLRATADATGEWSLVLASYGGSDGEANGDYVEYEIRVTKD